MKQISKYCQARLKCLFIIFFHLFIRWTKETFLCFIFFNNFYLSNQQNNHMGNSHSGRSLFEEHNWRQISYQNNKCILYNDLTMKTIERHETVVDCDQGQALQICAWRQGLNNQSCVVEVYQYGIKRAGMCNSQPDIYVITERIFLLKDIGSFSKIQALIILRDSAMALQFLFGKFGYFNPKLNLIGINSQGRARVWTNTNFAEFLPEKDGIPIQNSELGIVNNLIRLIDTKVIDQSGIQIQYPRNLDFASVVKYVDNVLSSLNGFVVNRVYLDRSEFANKFNELRIKTEQEEMSRTKAIEAEKRLREVELLQKNLIMQQMQLQRKEELLKYQTIRKYEQIERQKKNYQNQRMHEAYIVQQVPFVPDNIKMLKGMASTAQSDLNNPAYMRSQNNNTMRHSPSVQSYQNLNFRQSTASNKGQVKQRINLARQLSPRGRISENQKQSKPHNNQIPSQSTQVLKRPSVQKNALKKQIQLVDSMILVQQENEQQMNKRYIESRIIEY